MSLGVTRTGEGPLLLMLHGIGGSRTAWNKQIVRLSDQFTCLAPDLPGYGDSTDPAEPGLQVIVRDMVALLDGQSAHVMGVSFGALCALAIARELPEQVRSLVLADATLGRAGEEADKRAAWLKLRHELARDLGTHSRERAAKIAAPGAGPEVVDEIAAHMRRARAAGYSNVAETIAATDARPWLGRIDAPSLILCGEQDGVTGLEVSHRLADGLPNARLAMIAEAGHAPHIEQPDHFAAAVRSFLRCVDAV